MVETLSEDVTEVDLNIERILTIHRMINIAIRFYKCMKRKGQREE